MRFSYNESMKSPSLVLPAAIAIGGLIVAGAVYLSTNAAQPSTGSGTGNPSLVTPVGPSDHILGDPAAPVKIVEYADYDCEFCARFDTTVHQLIASEGSTGEVAWVYRNFPITQLHPEAYHAAEAAECVAQGAGNGAYWRFADSLFANEPAAPTTYFALAQAAGANTDTMAECMLHASTTVDAIINAQSANAQAVGAAGTPYSLILVPGYAPVVINGAWPYDELKAAVDAAIAEAK
jgi:protein-disulfide isomerase